MDINEVERKTVEEGDVYLKYKEEKDENEEEETALKESQRENIMGIKQIQHKGSSSVPTSPSADVENRPPVLPSTPSASPAPRPPPPSSSCSAPNSEEVWRQRCEVITSDEHKENIAFISDIVRNLVEELQLESDADFEHSGVAFSSETHSLCSVELSPSETSFNTAKEEEEEEGKRCLVSPLDKTIGTDTEFESVDEDGRNDSPDSFSYDQCKTVVAVRSLNVLVDSGHNLLCKPISCDLVNDSEANSNDRSVAVKEGFERESVESFESCVTSEFSSEVDRSLCEFEPVSLSVSVLSEEIFVKTEPEKPSESTLNETVESEPVLVDSSKECSPLTSLEVGLVTLENDSCSENNGFGNSPVSVFDRPTVLSCDVPNVEYSLSDVKETELVLSEHNSDDLKETTLEDYQIPRINLQLEASLVDSSFSESQTDSCLETVLKSESLGDGLEYSEITESRVREVIESVDPTVNEELCSESYLNVSIELDDHGGSQISVTPIVIVQSEVEKPIVTPDALAEELSKLDLNSKSFQSDLGGDSLITEENLANVSNYTEAVVVESLLNVTFPCVDSVSKGSSFCSIQSECDLSKDQTEVVNVAENNNNNNFDETLRPEPSFEDRLNENCEINEFENRLCSPIVVVGSPSTETSEQQLTSQVSLNEDNLCETTFVCTPQTFSSTVLSDVDFEQILQKETSYIVEELVNLSQHNNELEVETEQSIAPMPTAESQQSEDVVADAENNEALGLDVNINPFETRSKLTAGSPQRRLSAVDNERSIELNEQKTETSSKPSNDSPKRRASETNPSDVEPCSPRGHLSDSPKDDAIEEGSDLFKAPAKVNSSPTPDTDDGHTQQSLMESSMSEDSGIDVPPTSRPRSSASTAVEDCCSAMSQSIDGRSAVNFSEAGPDVAECKQEEFRSATDFFMDPSSLDFLEKCDSGKFAESALSRMSLYMKFDPLVPGNSPMSRRLTMWLKQQQDAVNRDTKPGSELPGSPSKSEIDGQKLIDLEASPLKLAAVGSSDSKTLANTSESSGEPMPQQEDGKKLCDEEVRQMLKIQELLFQDRQLMKDREWDDKLKAVEMEKQQLMAQVQSLRESQHQMRQIVGEYEKTISQLISDKEHDKQMMTESASQVTKERDQALEDLQSVETAFADLHRRYEKAKTAVEGFKKNEDTLKGCVNDLQTKLKRQVEKYELLRNRAEERLESANVQIENMGKANESEVAALRAQLKKSEMMVSGLENTLEQKVKENAELTSICDELIAQVGHKT